MAKLLLPIFVITIFFGCGDDITNKTTIDNRKADSVSSVPHPIPNPTQNQIYDKEFPPRPPSI